MEEARHRTLSRGFAILEAVAAAENGTSITELARSTNIEKSTVSRLVSSLQEIGYLNRLPDLRVVKVSFPRPVPQGSLRDRDMHSGQHHVPLAVLPLP